MNATELEIHAWSLGVELKENEVIAFNSTAALNFEDALGWLATCVTDNYSDSHTINAVLGTLIEYENLPFTLKADPVSGGKTWAIGALRVIISNDLVYVETTA